jgi:hypothetical protein
MDISEDPSEVVDPNDKKIVAIYPIEEYAQA